MLKLKRESLVSYASRFYFQSYIVKVKTVFDVLHSALSESVMISKSLDGSGEPWDWLPGFLERIFDPEQGMQEAGIRHGSAYPSPSTR